MKLFLTLALSACFAASALGGERPPLGCQLDVYNTAQMKKLKGIRLSVNFHNATLAEVLDYLRKRSRELDPEGQGVNLVLKESVYPAPVAPR